MYKNCIALFKKTYILDTNRKLDKLLYRHTTAY